MSDERNDRRDRGNDAPGFGWSGARRRLAPGAEPNIPPTEGSTARKAAPESRTSRLRPSGQLGNARGNWGLQEETPVPVPEEEERPQRPTLVKPGPVPGPDQEGVPPARRRPQTPPHDALKGNAQAEATKTRLHELLIEELEHGALEGLDPKQQREAVVRAARELIQQESLQLGGATRDEMLDAVADEVLGLGPLEPLLRDPAVTEVMVNDIDKIYYEQEGRLFRSPTRFRDRQHVMRIVERIVAPLGRRIDESSPMVDARLPDGSRVNITVPPASPKAASITIRKFRADKMRMADLIAVGSLSDATAEFLAMCVRAHLNVIISGGTGTGKTTMLNALSAFIPNTERIVTIEDPTELRLQQDHVITLEARPPSIEGRNAIKQRDLVRNSLRMRPDRIIVGEVRGEECFDMLQAMNTGHDGSISTVHANNPRDALARLENMVLMAGMDLPARAIREQIASAIDLFIQVQRLQDGSRRVTHVTECAGMEGDTITLQDIFLFKLDHVDEDGKVHGSMQPTGVRPGFITKFAIHGIEMPPHLFAAPGKEW
ncbi:MAG TPA: ATPase, T2SS/T4P/T4SS family [Tepidiformaceae bacterium]|nr:ATPase, T2SS/T4P/T4SS family [Tepidiformaceae bacterium]